MTVIKFYAQDLNKAGICQKVYDKFVSRYGEWVELSPDNLDSVLEQEWFDIEWVVALLMPPGVFERNLYISKINSWYSEVPAGEFFETREEERARLYAWAQAWCFYIGHPEKTKEFKLPPPSSKRGAKHDDKKVEEMLKSALRLHTLVTGSNTDSWDQDMQVKGVTDKFHRYDWELWGKKDSEIPGAIVKKYESAILLAFAGDLMSKTFMVASRLADLAANGRIAVEDRYLAIALHRLFETANVAQTKIGAYNK